MKDFEALKDIWHHQRSTPRISPEDVLKGVSKTRSSLANKLLFEVAGMGFVLAVLLFIWISIPFKMWTTHIAMLILNLCCLYFLYSQIRDYKLISDNSLLLSKPEDYIAYLKKYRHDRHILNTRKYLVYTIFLSLSFFLYFVEIAFLAPLWVTILGAAFTIAWILICYFVLMRSYILREESKLQEMISKLEKLQRQFEEDKAEK